MKFEEGMIIKTFPETQVQAYTDWIHAEGYKCKVYRDYIQIGRRFKTKIDPSLFGKVISRRRKHLGWTREDLAHYVGVRTNIVVNWEIGQSRPSTGNLYKVIEGLEITEEELESCIER